LSETVVPDYVKFMHVYGFNGLNFTSRQRSDVAHSMSLELTYYHFIHLLSYYRLNIIELSKVLSV